MDHPGMDHSEMDHPGLDHPGMDHPGMGHREIGYPGVDPGVNVGHSGVDQLQDISMQSDSVCSCHGCIATSCSGVPGQQFFYSSTCISPAPIK